MKTDWEAWSKRSLGKEDSVRLILATVRVRPDNKAICCWLSSASVATTGPAHGPRPTSSIPLWLHLFSRNSLILLDTPPEKPPESRHS